MLRPNKQCTLSNSCSLVKLSLVSFRFFKLGLRLFLGGGARPWVKEPSISEFLFTMDSVSFPLLVVNISSYDPLSS